MLLLEPSTWGQVAAGTGWRGGDRHACCMSWFLCKERCMLEDSVLVLEEDLIMLIREVKEKCSCGRVIFSNWVYKIWGFGFRSQIMKGQFPLPPPEDGIRGAHVLDFWVLWPQGNIKGLFISELKIARHGKTTKDTFVTQPLLVRPAPGLWNPMTARADQAA